MTDADDGYFQREGFRSGQNHRGPQEEAKRTVGVEPIMINRRPCFCRALDLGMSYAFHSCGVAILEFVLGMNGV